MLISRDHSIENQKKIIMDNFQWDEIKKIFDFMDWKYASSPNPDDDYLPEIHHLKELVTELLETVTANPSISYISSSGRFQAKWNADDELLSLSFIPYESEILHDEPNETIFLVN
jgi:hypothetical protein